MSSVARSERHALCDTLTLVGADAPTLCEGWTTRNLAAHLVLRESRPDAAAGVIIVPLARHTEKVQNSIAATEWGELVDTVRSGPPVWSPLRLAPLDALANTVEFFVHHEDIRRAQTGWTSRPLSTGLEAALRTALGRMARLLCRRVGVGLHLAVTQTDPEGAPSPTGAVHMITARRGRPEATLTGPAGELILFLYGRGDHAAVELTGAPSAISAVQAARFGV